MNKTLLERIAELEAKLEQQDAQPVAWRVWSPDGENKYQYTENGDGEPLYTHPAPKQVPLTDEQIKAIVGDNSLDTIHSVIRAVEAAHVITGDKP